jgi:membrane protease YdiL (CAAX protease family)
MAITRPYVSVADDQTIVLNLVRALAVVAGAFLFAGLFGQLGAALLGAEIPLDAASMSAGAYAAVNAISFVGFVLAAIAFVQVRGEAKLLHLRRPELSDLAWTVVGLLGIAVGAFVMGFVVEALSIVVEALSGSEVQTGQNSIITAGRANPTLLLYMIPVALFFVGPAEEIVFRGVVQGLFRESFGVVPGIVAASALFGVGHYLAISSGSAWTYILTAGALGLVLGTVYEYSENIAVPAVAHGLWNSTIFIVNYYAVTAGVALPT